MDLTDPRTFIDDIVQMSKVALLSSALETETSPSPNQSTYTTGPDGHTRHHHSAQPSAVVTDDSTITNGASSCENGNTSQTGSLPPAASQPPISSASFLDVSQTNGGTHALTAIPECSTTSTVAPPQRDGENPPAVASHDGEVGM
jgi:hypothetical protein